MADSSVPPTVAPYIAYENPAKAIEWLVNTFGFTTLGVFDDGRGRKSRQPVHLKAGIAAVAGRKGRIGFH